MKQDKIQDVLKIIHLFFISKHLKTSKIEENVTYCFPIHCTEDSEFSDHLCLLIHVCLVFCGIMYRTPR